MTSRVRELIDCHDCGNAVSFSAACCPHCGSREHFGPYMRSARELRRFDIERRNDRNAGIVAGTAAAIGALYGVGTSSTWLGASIAAVGFGLLGLLVGVPIAVAVNLTRRIINR